MAELAELDAGRLKNPDCVAPRTRDCPRMNWLRPIPRLRVSSGASCTSLRSDFAWSVDLLHEAAQGLPGQPELAYDLARAQYAVGEVTQAEATLDGVQQSSADIPLRTEAERFSALIAAAKDSSLADAALSSARKRIDSEPGYVPALMVIARAEEDRGNYTAAGGAYDKILAVDPLFSPATRQLAILCARHLNDYQKAYQLAERAQAGVSRRRGIGQGHGNGGL